MNMKHYGDPLGPSLDYLRHMKNKSWEDIIKSASNPGGWNRYCDFLKKNGIDPYKYFEPFE